jgi:hypothetical protein
VRSSACPRLGVPSSPFDGIGILPNLGDTNRFTDDELALAPEWFETTFD